MMRGIFLVFLIGYVTAHSHQSSYDLQEQQQQRPQQQQGQYEQAYPPLNSQTQGVQEPRQQQTLPRLSKMSDIFEGLGNCLTSISHRSHTTQMEPRDIDESSPTLQPDSKPATRNSKQRPLLIQAQPPPSATYRPVRKPIWSTTTPAYYDGMFSSNVNSFADGASTADATAGMASTHNSHNNFSADLFQLIAGSRPQHNIVYSPISLQMLLAFVYTGTSGQTARQLQRALSLPDTPESTAQLFLNFLHRHLITDKTQLVMANKMYHSHRLTLQPNIQQLARSFASDIEAINFAMSYRSAASINEWIAQKTQNIITELVTPSEFDEQTQAILVSAIHFKAKWAKPFSAEDTEQQNFHVTPSRTLPVDMMYSDDTYSYGEFPDLDARALEMKYENSKMSMLVLLPNKLDGLAAMERRLQRIDLNKLTSLMKMESVTVRMPKFRVDFEWDFQEPLKELGVTRLFTKSAELNGFFHNQQVGVSQLRHKAFLHVNEAGSEAAAASFIKLIPLSLPNRVIRFTVDRPFVFAIRSSEAVFFIGHVVNI
ncbi:PREDICTED: alaserpin-like [Rhagoletis zephyria]|uniref:alaserpin-like n=1 Tax=Rhagoletis zephyria TaxID=28612 RepID=UPI0008119731|nr:PREDICTED: alaserpin-like [Rhagoletis zephyria]XP_017482544.1 PREDICTED: alaserpin-like [Rhagoletis zephyria]